MLYKKPIFNYRKSTEIFLKCLFYRVTVVAAFVAKTDQKKQKDAYSTNIFVET